MNLLSIFSSSELLQLTVCLRWHQLSIFDAYGCYSLSFSVWVTTLDRGALYLRFYEVIEHFLQFQLGGPQDHTYLDNARDVSSNCSL